MTLFLDVYYLPCYLQFLGERGTKKREVSGIPDLHWIGFKLKQQIAIKISEQNQFNIDVYVIHTLHNIMVILAEARKVQFTPKPLESYKLPHSNFLSFLICQRIILTLLNYPIQTKVCKQSQFWKYLKCRKQPTLS